MNGADLAYYDRIETDKNAEQLRAKLADLAERGVRVRMRSGAGSVAVNAFGVVTDVVIDRDNCAYTAEEVLADYLVEALRAAESRARKVRDQLLSYDEMENI